MNENIARSWLSKVKPMWRHQLYNDTTNKIQVTRGVIIDSENAYDNKQLEPDDVINESGSALLHISLTYRILGYSIRGDLLIQLKLRVVH